MLPGDGQVPMAKTTICCDREGCGAQGTEAQPDDVALG